MRAIGYVLLMPQAILLSLAVGAAPAAEPLAARPARPISAASKVVRDKIDLKAADGCSHIYGFNYQPSWGYNGLTVWGDKFDARRYREELAVGKKYFAKFNAVRIWLSWSAYRVNPERTIREFQTAVDIAGDLDLLVVPVIFNRWMGGPLWDRVTNKEIAGDFDATFAPFIRDLVTPMKGDRRILAWDLCNEPFLDSKEERKANPVSPEVETRWLTSIRDTVKRCDGDALTCVGVNFVLANLERTAHLQDILTIHPYHPTSLPVKSKGEPWKHHGIEATVKMAQKLGKPIMATECCWGDPRWSDEDHALAVRINLQAMKHYKLGFFPHALWTSGVADLHKGGMNMAFILEDGSLRPGHEVYNEFAR